MNTRPFFAALTLCLLALSCRNANRKEIMPCEYEESVSEGGIPVIDTIRVADSCRLCTQKLTGAEYVFGKLCPDDGTWDREQDPAEAAFFVPEEGVRNDGLCRALALRYNCAAVFNRVVHSYELYARKLTEAEDTSMTRRDTLDIIVHDRPQYRMESLGRYIRDAEALREARSFIAAYRRFDGDEEPLAAALRRYRDFRATIPELASKELLDDFEEHFWEWYDKRRHVPQIDDIVLLRLHGSDVELTPGQYERLESAAKGETDIDRRAILAIEAAHLGDGTLLLGEIIESGIYTRYLLEVWLLWRAKVQMNAIGPSSFCTIPNNYYDRMRVKCMNTILRHMQTDPDRYDACLLENFIGAGILHRQASISGNESIAILADMRYGQFVDPRLLE